MHRAGKAEAHVTAIQGLEAFGERSPNTLFPMILTLREGDLGTSCYFTPALLFKMISTSIFL